MLVIVERDQKELENFYSTFGFMPEDVKGYKILLQGDEIEGEYEPEKEKIVNIYSEQFRNIINRKLSRAVIEPDPDINIHNERPSCCIDFVKPSSNARIRQYIAGGISVCIVDYYGNLHFIDFIHDARIDSNRAKSFLPILFKILIKENHQMVDDVKNTITISEFMSAMKNSITDFVKNSNVFNIMTTVITNSLQKMHNYQIEIYKSEIENMKKEIETKNEALLWQAFIAGKELSKDWEVVDANTLGYKKKIYADKIMYNGKIVPAEPKKYYISGLKVFYNRGNYGAYCEKSYHPNASANGTVCIGDIREVKTFIEFIRLVKEIPTMLKTVSLNSAYDEPARATARNEFKSKDSVAEVFDFSMSVDE
ncbi:MAG TPA: hypothetical protein PKV92_07915 [Thermodesulfovibrio thiophilus]|nr:hypothetical protein [Thermodesulfovibrio thiophilus]